MNYKNYLLVALFLPFTLQAQRETTNWYFGNGAGIQFNPDGTVGSLSDGAMDTFEGCTTISDLDGNLLFYTDGITVYNKNHTVMENGNDLYGHPSSTQSAIIVPKPEDPNIFYIFTVDTQLTGDDFETPYDGFNYSVVDMGLNNGLGGVAQKNINLLEASAEKITAVLKDCREGSLWVITLSTADGKPLYFEADDGTIYPYYEYDTFHSFEVNTQGISQTAITSSFPNQIMPVWDPRGYLKLSSDGTKLACAHPNNGLFLYDFDVDTGKVSNEKKIPLSLSDQFPYGIEFSQNNRFLYVHASNDLGTELEAGQQHEASLLRYDTNAENLAGSEVVIEERKLFRGALQLGDNGKIYRTLADDYENGTSYLGVINDPNEESSAVDYRHNAVALDGIAMQGLPPFIQSFFKKEALALLEDGTTTNRLFLGLGGSFTLAADVYPNAHYIWRKDGTILENYNGNRLEVVGAVASDSGRYRLEIAFPNEPKACPIIAEAFITVTSDFTINYPKFFTPNNDGVNDYWQLNALDESIKGNFSVSIYNRYGKLIANATSDSLGWDGTYRGTPMPSTDYWFTATLEGKGSFGGHFSLKR